MADLRQSEDRLRRVESRQNARVKGLRQAFHDAAPDEQGAVAVEGMHLLEEAIRAGLRMETVFFSESALARAHKLLPQLSAHAEALLLPDEVFASAVPTETPQGIAALVKVRTFVLDDVFRPEPALVVSRQACKIRETSAPSPALPKPLAQLDCCWRNGRSVHGTGRPCAPRQARCFACRR